MKRATAVHAVHHAAEACRDAGGLGLETIRELWVHGPLLDGDVGDALPEAVVTLDLPPEEVPWRVTPPEGDALTDIFQTRKIPLTLVWRSWRGPVNNHHITRPMRVWADQKGAEVEALTALATPPVAGGLRLPEIPPSDLLTQLEGECLLSRNHLEGAVAGYWDPAWRRDHRGRRRYPEHHLWEASRGHLELLSALEALANGGARPTIG